MTHANKTVARTVGESVVEIIGPPGEVQGAIAAALRELPEPERDRALVAGAEGAWTIRVADPIKPRLGGAALRAWKRQHVVAMARAARCYLHVATRLDVVEIEARLTNRLRRDLPALVAEATPEKLREIAACLGVGLGL